MLIELQNVYDAARANNLEFLLEFHMNMLNLVGHQGDDTFLHIACANGSDMIIDYLLDNGVDVDAVNSNNKTPLMMAYEKNSKETIEKLIKHGADANRYYPSGINMIQKAILDGKFEIAELFREKGANINNRTLKKKNPTILYILTAKNKTIKEKEDFAIKWINEHGLELCSDYQLKDGKTTFSMLIESEFIELMIKAFTDNPELINQQNSKGKTALMLASIKGNVEIVKILITQGKAKIDLVDSKGNNALKYACKYGNIEVIKILIKSGSDPNIFVENIIVWTAINHDDSVININPVLETLDELLPSIKISNQRDGCQILLRQASHYGWDLIVRKIIENISSSDQGWKTVIGGKNKSTVVDLDENITPGHCDLCGIGHIGGTVFQLACKSGHSNIAKMLLDAGANPFDQKGSLILDPLPNSGEIMSLLIERNIYKVDPKTPIGFYPTNVKKTICLHLKMNRNEEDFVTLEDVVDIPDDRFILTSNKIAWDIENLVNYIIKIAKGINKYDEKTPFKGEEIWTDSDLSAIHNHPAENADGKRFGVLLKDYLDLSTVFRDMTKKTIDMVYQVGCVLSASGSAFDNILPSILDQSELQYWERKKNRLVYDSMPNMNSKITKKFEMLKQEKLFELNETFKKLPSSEQKALNELYHMDNSSYYSFEDHLLMILQGRDCIMGYGHLLKKLADKFETYQQKILNFDSKSPLIKKKK